MLKLENGKVDCKPGDISENTVWNHCEIIFTFKLQLTDFFCYRAWEQALGWDLVGDRLEMYFLCHSCSSLLGLGWLNANDVHAFKFVLLFLKKMAQKWDSSFTFLIHDWFKVYIECCWDWKTKYEEVLLN